MTYKNIMDLWFKSKKDRRIAIAKRDLTGSRLEKELATIEYKPYVNVSQIDVDPVNPKKGVVKLDFNEQFVTMLQTTGYSGKSDDDLKLIKRRSLNGKGLDAFRSTKRISSGNSTKYSMGSSKN